ncbi:hypothetical protein LSAT2_010690 [Lamellibrachia satsuma]|nr:hypothetical protein LSAT2_010690 [Lamellibrachia satsuma]
MALPLYTELLVIGNQQEQQLAAQGIWRLAFRCKDFIIQEPGCIEALQKLASSDVEDVSKDAKGALWELGEHKQKIDEKTTKRKDSTGVYP